MLFRRGAISAAKPPKGWSSEECRWHHINCRRGLHSPTASLTVAQRRSLSPRVKLRTRSGLCTRGCVGRWTCPQPRMPERLRVVVRVWLYEKAPEPVCGEGRGSASTARTRGSECWLSTRAERDKAPSKPRREAGVVDLPGPARMEAASSTGPRQRDLDPGAGRGSG